MAEFFFNRHSNAGEIEPFSDYKYSTKDEYYTFSTMLTCDATDGTGNQSGNCTSNIIIGNTSIPGNSEQDQINNCLCKYRKNVDKYLEKKPLNVTMNGISNDNVEKYSDMTMKNVNLGIGIALMMFYVYKTNY